MENQSFEKNLKERRALANQAFPYRNIPFVASDSHPGEGVAEKKLLNMPATGHN